MKKILVLSAHSISLDRRIISQVNALADEGYDVTLISIPVFEDFYGTLSTNIKFISPSLKGNEKNLLNSIKKYFLNYLPNQIQSHLRFLHSKHSIKKLEKFFLENMPPLAYDIIHAHDLSTLPAAVKIKQRSKKSLKIIYDAHEIFSHMSSRKKEIIFWRKLEQSLLNYVDHFITINPSCAAFFKETYPNCPPLKIIYNSYSLDKVDFKRLSRNEFLKYAGIKNNLPVALFHGGLSAGRNLFNLIKAFKSLEEQLNLIILGQGPFKEKLIKIKNKYHIDNVYFLDWVDQMFLPSILQHIDIGIIPYLYDNKLNHLYCTPNKLFEFMYFQIPTCSNQLPELSKIIDGHGIGKTYKFDSEDDIRLALQDMLKRKESIQPEQFIKALSVYGWDKQREELLKIYKNVS